MNVLVSMIGKYSIRGHQFGIVIIPPAVVLLLSSSSLFDNPVGGIYSPFLTVSNFGVGVTKSSSKKKKEGRHQWRKRSTTQHLLVCLVTRVFFLFIPHHLQCISFSAYLTRKRNLEWI